MAKPDKFRTVEMPLKNVKHEYWLNIMVREPDITPGEAYIKSGFTCTPSSAIVRCRELLAKPDIKDRYNYLLAKAFKDAEEYIELNKTYMIAKAHQMMLVAMGEKPTKKLRKLQYKEKIDGAYVTEDVWEEYEVKEHDLKAFSTIWDKLCVMQDYYPKADNNTGADKKLKEMLNTLRGTISEYDAE